MSAKRILTAAFTALFSLGATLLADSVTLKSGEKIEGKILKETETEVILSVQVSATIKDERVFKREDLASVDKVQPDEEAWAPIANLAPGNESLAADEYGRAVAAFDNFLKAFPQSKHTATAKQRLDEFLKEQRRVDAGEVKLDGQWLSKDQVQEERVQIAGRILFNRMKRSSAAGQLIEAMTIFAQMEKTFPGTATYPDAVELGRRILPSLKVAVEQRQGQLKRRIEDENKRLTTSKGQEHAQLDALLKKERAAAEASVTAAERAGVKWLPLQPATEKSLTSLASFVASETTRLNGLPTDKMHESVNAAQKAASALASGSLDAADKSLKDATSAWAANELAKRLQVKLADARKEASAPKAATPTPEPTPKPTPTPKPKPVASTPSPSDPTPPSSGESSPFYKNPIVLIVLAAVVAFGAIGGKMLAKKRANADISEE